MQKRKNEVPNKPRFKLAAQRAYEILIDLNLSSFPVDPFYIMDQYGWNYASYLQLKMMGEADPFFLGRDNAEAKTMRVRGSNEYMTIYDDRVTNESRVRWTIAHEIGHIALGHLDHFEATALNRSGLTQSEYGVLEVEAHWFAAELLCPRPIVQRLKLNDSASELGLMFDISKEAAMKIILKLKDYYYIPRDIQLKLLRNFYSHFLNNEYHEAIFNSANRYVDTKIYSELCKYIRVCPSCLAYIDDGEQRYCHVCGNEMPSSKEYRPFKAFQPGSFHIGYDYLLKGKNHPTISTDDDNRVLFCPICKNHLFTESAGHCRICGTPLFNKCIHENKKLDAKSRYCPDCGSETTFKEVYDKLSSGIKDDELVNIDEDLDDFIKYDYWDFVKAAINSLERDLDLYSVLADTVMFRDGSEYVLVIKQKNTLTQIQNNIPIIKEAIKKYGCTEINEVRCYYAL